MNYLPIVIAVAFFLLNKPSGCEKDKSSAEINKIAPLLANPDALEALKCVNRLFDAKTPQNEKMPAIFELLANPFVTRLLEILGSGLCEGLQSFGSGIFGSDAPASSGNSASSNGSFSENSDYLGKSGFSGSSNSAENSASSGSSNASHNSDSRNFSVSSNSAEKSASSGSSNPAENSNASDSPASSDGPNVNEESSDRENDKENEDAERVYREIRNDILSALSE